MKKMKFFICILFFFLLFFSCKNKTNEVVTLSNTTLTKLSDTLFNLSKYPKLLSLNKKSVSLATFEVEKNLNFTSNVKEQFLSIRFPFSFFVNDILIKKGDRVTKGQKLFVLHSEELRKAISIYKNTKNMNIAQTLNSIGIQPDISEPSSDIEMIAASSGIVSDIKVEKEKSYPPQELTVIKRETDSTFEVLVPKDIFNDDTNFFIITENQEILATIKEQTTETNGVKVKLTANLPPSIGSINKIAVKGVFKIRNTFIISKSSVLEKQNQTYLFVSKGEGLVEKRMVNGFYENDNFIVTEGINENEIVFEEGIDLIEKYTS